MDRAHSPAPQDNDGALWEDIYLDKGTDDEYEDASENQPDAPNSSRLSHHKSQKQYIPMKGVRRYNGALKNLILIRNTKRSGKSLGLDEAGLWSFLTFSWLSKFIYKAYKHGIGVEDIPDISPFDSSEYNVQRLEMLWHDELAKKGPGSASLGKAAWRFMRTRIIVTSVLFTLYIVIGFISIAFLMRYLLEFAESEDESWVVGLKWALLLALSEIVRVTLYSLIWALNLRTALRMRSACLTMLYRKILRLNCLGKKSAGELINLFSNDGQRIYDLVLFGPFVIGGPITILLGSIYIYWLLGPWALLGFSSMFLFYPVQFGLSKLGGYFKSKALSATDRRISYISEILYSIKLIKMCAWNKVFTKGIDEIRKEELSSVRKNAYCTSLTSSLASTAPIVSSILTLVAHILVEHTITASQAFTLIAFNTKLMKTSLSFTRDAFKSIVDYHLALQRFKPVLVLNETNTLLSRSLDKSQAVCIANGTFVRESAQCEDEQTKKKTRKGAKTDEETMKLNCLPASPYTVILRDVNFYASKRKLIGVCGPVGCGKSSLLLSVMGLLRMTEGKLCREGSCAYVSQQSWLLNATVKENILFGEKFNAKRYFTVLHYCCLNEDIDALPGGDGTEVGDRGITLSGGQKQRIALARALYSDRDIYLLDDPLSSVDNHVGNQIFEKCILAGMKSKAVIFVTNQPQFLCQCNEVVVMKEGTIVERGTHDELKAKNGEYAVMIQTFCKKPCEEGESSTTRENSISNHFAPGNLPSVDSTDKIIFPGKPLVLNEKVAKGSIKLHTFLSYIKATGGPFVFFIAVIIMLFNVGSAAFSSWWLAMWIKAGDGNTTTPYNKTVELHLTDNPSYDTYLLVYFLSIVAIILTNLLRTLAFTQVTLKASSHFFNRLFQKLISSPMLFFETTPVGRMQNLFTKDIDEVETRLPSTLESLIQGIWQVAAAILFICIVFRWFIFPLIFLAALYYIINKVYRVGIRDLKRLDNLTRSPIFSNVSATVLGLDTIHAFNKEKDFINKFIYSFDLNAVCLFMNSMAHRWLALRVDFIAVIVMLITSLFVILLHGEVSPSLAGLAIAYAASLSGIFQYTIRLVTDNEAKFLSVERINIYLEGMEQEGGHGPKGVPPEKWPDLGSVKFKNVKLQYRLGLPFALDNVSFKVDPAQKIGIVGRTGAGKSSLVSALFRLVELQGGKINIDSLDISTIDIETLRSRLSIIPQDPVLFSGTLRYNLDPLNLFQDIDIWSVLEKTKLKDKVSADPEKLNFKVKLNGENLSVGERQLVCMARALLRGSKIMVLDEATSGLDPETEKFVHDTIFSEFKHCTILLIAHRLDTVRSCDKVLVIDSGKVAEYDTPEKLLNNPDSFFTKLIKASVKREAHIESH